MAKLTDQASVAAYAAQVARHRGWVVNSDQGLTGTVTAGLAAMAGRLGKPYCPCRDVDGGPSDADVVCPCTYAAADIAEHGQCYCGLYLAPGKDPQEVSSIPERRP